MGRTKTYDSQCWNLADYFLSETQFNTHKNTHELAYEIQQCIEDFLADLEQHEKEKET